MKYKALAYIGLAWLNDLGTFDTTQEAMDALEEEHNRQADQENESEWDSNATSEAFWANSRVEEVQS